ncbi:hypothetical protein EV361DRAFT_966999 [Lentinula raphanica]|nr:hypothetical protein EV361DRAFT_966999 [Lentinula raphanica]
MRLADVAWKAVEAGTIANCWRKSGILPALDNVQAVTHTILAPISSLIHDTSDPIANVEHEVEQRLDDLEARGVLQHSNRMNIESLLNPVVEWEFMNEDMVEGIEQGIFKSVMNAVHAREDSEINGGDDDADNDYPVASDPCPSRRKALAAVSTVQRYIQDMDEPFAWKLEGLPASFGRQARLEDAESRVQTKIIEYLAKN